jgi:hypothetical protein
LLCANIQDVGHGKSDVVDRAPFHTVFADKGRKEVFIPHKAAPNRTDPVVGPNHRRPATIDRSPLQVPAKHVSPFAKLTASGVEQRELDVRAVWIQ